MLILTRRVGETVVIGNDVDVTVLGVKGNQVRLGIKAPHEVSVHREEVYNRIKEEPAAARPDGRLSANHGNGNGAAHRVNGHASHADYDDHRPAVND